MYGVGMFGSVNYHHCFLFNTFVLHFILIYFNFILHQGDLCHISYWSCDSQNLHVFYPMFVCDLWFTRNALCFNVPHLVLLVLFNIIWCFVFKFFLHCVSWIALCFKALTLMFKQVINFLLTLTITTWCYENCVYLRFILCFTC